MGRGTAEWLLAGGYRLRVYNRTAEKAAALNKAAGWGIGCCHGVGSRM